MTEIFSLTRASVQIFGFYPLCITAATKTGANEVTATAAILSRFPSGKTKVMSRTERLRGKMGQPLPEFDWTKVLAGAVTEWLTNDWMDAVQAENDPVWNEYLRVKGPLAWVEKEEPALELLRSVLLWNDSFLNELATLADAFPTGLAANAVRQAIDFRLKVRLDEKG